MERSTWGALERITPVLYLHTGYFTKLMNGLYLTEQALIKHSNTLALEGERTKRIPCMYKDFVIYLNLSLIELHAVPGSDVIGI